MKKNYRATILSIISAIALVAITGAVNSGCTMVDHVFYEDGAFDNADYSEDINDTLEHNYDLDLDQEEHN